MQNCPVAQKSFLTFTLHSTYEEHNLGMYEVHDLDTYESYSVRMRCMIYVILSTCEVHDLRHTCTYEVHDLRHTRMYEVHNLGMYEVQDLGTYEVHDLDLVLACGWGGMRMATGMKLKE